MIVTKSVFFPLYPRKSYSAKFYAMCGEIHFAPPYIESYYYIGDIVDTNIVKLTQYLDRYYIQDMIGQHALWAYTDEAGFNELEKYGADSLTIEMTKGILYEVNIQTKLTDSANINQTRQTIRLITLKSYIVYSAGVLIVILLVFTLVLYMKIRNNKNIA